MECPRGYCEKCFENGIAKRASYGLLNEQRRCSQHKEEGMSYTMQPSCQVCLEEGVKNVARFGYSTDRKRIRCSRHKDENMVNLTILSRICVVCADNGDFKEAYFGYPDGKKERCYKHKEPGMIRITSKRKRVFLNLGTPLDSVACLNCLEIGTIRIATHGYPNEEKIYCFEHKREGMTGTKTPCDLCLEKGVSKTAYYGFPEDRKRVRCSRHKEEGMIDLSNKTLYCVTCREEGILKRAYYGKPFKDKAHCQEHQLPGESRIKYPKCKLCSLNAFYGNPSSDKIPQRCQDHRLPGDLNLISN